MDSATALHLQTWLDKTVRWEDRPTTLAMILRFDANHPEVLCGGDRAWSEIRRLAEREGA